MSKIAICADIHFGVPGRTDDIIWACELIRQYCNINNIDNIIVLGDLYHNRQSIDIDINHKVFKFFEHTFKDYKQNWIVFPGNHDMFLRYSWKINSLYPLKKYMTVIEDVSILKIDNTNFWIVPFITYEKTYMKVINTIIKHEKFNHNQDYLLTHIGVRSATMNTCFLIKDWSIVSFENLPFKKVFTGHFHSQQQIGKNVFYPGSPIPFKFDEGDVAHGFYILDIDKEEQQFIDLWDLNKQLKPNTLPPPQFKTISEEDVDKLSLDDIQYNNIRISSIKELTNKEKSDIKNKLKNQNVKNVRWLDLSIKDEINEKVINNTKLTGDIFDQWLSLDAKNLKDLDHKVLKQCNQEIVHEADEIYSIESNEE